FIESFDHLQHEDKYGEGQKTHADIPDQEKRMAMTNSPDNVGANLEDDAESCEHVSHTRSAVPGHQGDRDPVERGQAHFNGCEVVQAANENQGNERPKHQRTLAASGEEGGCSCHWAADNPQ